MSMSNVQTAVGPTSTVTVKWDISPNEYECVVVLCPEDVGFSAYVERLPGIVSEGDTEEETLRNIKDALTAALHLYLEDGSIPWAGKDEAVAAPEGAKKRWVLVNV